MPICVEEQDARGLAFPVIVGGAAINRDFGRRIALLDEGKRFFEPGVFYAKDAFEGLEIIDALDGRCRDARARLLERTKREAFAAQSSRRAALAGADRRRLVRRVKAERADVPHAAVLGRAHARRHRRARVVAVLRSASLYRLSWGGANAKGDAWERSCAKSSSRACGAISAEALRGRLARSRASSTATSRPPAWATT